MLNLSLVQQKAQSGKLTLENAHCAIEFQHTKSLHSSSEAYYTWPPYIDFRLLLVTQDHEVEVCAALQGLVVVRDDGAGERRNSKTVNDSDGVIKREWLEMQDLGGQGLRLAESMLKTKLMPSITMSTLLMVQATSSYVNTIRISLLLYMHTGSGCR